jgi:hypothetical protein
LPLVWSRYYAWPTQQLTNFTSKDQVIAALGIVERPASEGIAAQQQPVRVRVPQNKGIVAVYMIREFDTPLAVRMQQKNRLKGRLHSEFVSQFRPSKDLSGEEHALTAGFNHLAPEQ